MKRKFIIQWHITGKCNLRCRHCYMEDYTKDLEMDDLVKIFNQIKNFLQINDYVGHINFTGGEPFVSEQLWGLLELCDDNGITFGILTNGTIIDSQILQKIRQRKNLKFIQFSLDGCKKTHDYIRGAGAFDKTAAAIKLANKYTIETMVSFTAGKTNYRELSKVIGICRKLKVKRFWTDRLVPFGGNTLDIMDNREFSEYLSILGREKDLSVLLDKWGVRTTYIHTNRALQFMCGSSSEFYKCSAGKSLLTILEDGTLLPCRRLPLVLGNLLNDNLANIYDESSIISRLKVGNISEGCEKCLHIDTCNGGAKCLTYAVNGKLNSKDINCRL